MKMYKRPEIEITEVRSLHVIMDGSLLPGNPINQGDPVQDGD